MVTSSRASGSANESALRPARPDAVVSRGVPAVCSRPAARHRGLPTGSMIASSDAGTSSQNGQKKTPRSSQMAAHTTQNATHRARQSRPPKGRFSGIAITPVTTTLRREQPYSQPGATDKVGYSMRLNLRNTDRCWSPSGTRDTHWPIAAYPAECRALRAGYRAHERVH
jgi:hypothetical protein